MASFYSCIISALIPSLESYSPRSFGARDSRRTAASLRHALAPELRRVCVNRLEVRLLEIRVVCQDLGLAHPGRQHVQYVPHRDAQTPNTGLPGPLSRSDGNSAQIWISRDTDASLLIDYRVLEDLPCPAPSPRRPQRPLKRPAYPFEIFRHSPFTIRSPSVPNGWSVVT